MQPRRVFLKQSAGFVAAGVFAGQASSTRADEAPPSRVMGANAGRIYKSVKWGMVGEPGSVLDKFLLQKELGFDGVELDSPTDLDLDEVVSASRKTEMPVHGVVDPVHWNDRLSSPKEAIREKGLNALIGALKDTQHLGGSSVLLVPGRVSKKAEDDENHDQVWQRSIVEIRKALPLASRLGVRILIENVWNGFCETPDQLRDYIDEIASPWVGVYFDIGNVRKFGPSENWIRALRHRIVKLDVKDWGKSNGFCKIGDGDVNWPEVRKALAETGFSGWCTAEVGGGKKDRLTDIATRMNKVLAL